MATRTSEHLAVVTDNNDPEKRGRLKVRCQSLVGAGVELPDWLPPADPFFVAAGGYGALFLPTVDTTVELVADETDDALDERPGERFIQNPCLRWRPAAYTSSSGPQKLPEEMASGYPNVRGWKFPSGHLLLFSCDPSDKWIKLVHADGRSVEMKHDGEVSLNGKNGQGVVIGPTGAISIGTASSPGVSVAGGGSAVGRVGDTVQVTIPTGGVQVDPVTHANPAPIVATGQITGGSPKLQSG